VYEEETSDKCGNQAYGKCEQYLPQRTPPVTVLEETFNITHME